MKKRKNKKSNIILYILIFVGLSVMLYPSVSNLWNSKHISKAIATYEEKVNGVDEEECQRLIDEAQSYNKNLSKNFIIHNLSDEELQKYNSILDITGTGIMGYIEIPSIDVKLPIYHGVDESVLQVAAGHVEWSSLPVGGQSTHCIISGHRGLPSAKLFTELDGLLEGDTFNIRILNKTFWYQVDKISIVLPDELNNLTVTKGMDYVTLVTCTPYGINTHRLLVRGHRIVGKDLDFAMKITADAAVVSPVIPAIIIFTLLVLLVVVAPPFRKSKKKPKIFAEEK